MAKSLQASQNIQTIASKMDQLMGQAANEIAEFIVDLTKSGKGSVTSISKDIENLMSSIPSGLREEIYIRALATVAKSLSNTSSGKGTKKVSLWDEY